MSDQTENRIDNIFSLVKSAEKNLNKASKLLYSLKKDLEGSFDDIPGILGIFDGKSMVTPEGKSYEVNPNYSAKSMLVVGDNLKMVEEDGKHLFKQISKVPREVSKGVLNKKEGKWYAITDSGSYKLLEVAVDFRRGKVSDEVEVLIPEDNSNVDFAALKKLAKEDERPVIDKEKAEENKEDKKEEKKQKKKPTKKSKPKSKKKTPNKKKDKKEEDKKKKEPKKKEKREETSSILEEDDLV